ncbi:DUF3788 family protein [Flavobacterium sp.]|uniref:DUF3788 family protein n=1 Tax=Flavobacterium sp. TaxID=239 RepID=UPI002FDD695C
MTSIFLHKDEKPSEAQLQKAVGHTYPVWKTFTDYTLKKHPEATAEWHYSSEKFGWSFRIKDKKRVLIYLLPRDQFFKVAFVFGTKATDEILTGPIAESVKTELSAAKPYAEGRGIRIVITDESLTDDILKLIDIKLKY